ncbi:MAG: hypothetical protein GY882_11195 [Actinomycetia bacterium]|nr:hypothetical protein [Actinomycetes bacterium]
MTGDVTSTDRGSAPADGAGSGARRSGLAWHPAEAALVRTLLAIGANPAEVAVVVGRSQSAIRQLD